MKIAVIGGSGVYTPNLIKEIIRYNLPVDEVILNGRTKEKLELVAEYCRELVKDSAVKIQVSTNTDRIESIKNADFVISQIRTGGMKARAFDESFPRELGLIGDETYGVGGFSDAVRTLPIAVEISREIAEYAPDAYLIDLTNPASMVMRASRDAADIKMVAVCDMPAVTMEKIAGLLGCSTEKMFVNYYGLNHLGFFDRIIVNGEDRTNEVLGMVEGLGLGVDAHLIRGLGVVPLPNLRLYYHPHEVLKGQAGKPRGEVLAGVEEEIMVCLDTKDYNKLEAYYGRRATPWYGIMAGLMAALMGIKPGYFFLNVINNELLDFLPDEAVVEVYCYVDKNGVHPIHIEMVSDEVKPLISTINEYEERTQKAIIKKDMDGMIRALMIHPEIRDYELARTVVERVMAAN
ncbi:MAG: hypothetical protein QME46_03085 [Thermoanaerobacteraceae bacterium]|nr:hypothetical protein [Thermoanaerobacteraceae bacterium]